MAARLVMLSTPAASLHNRRGRSSTRELTVEGAVIAALLRESLGAFPSRIIANVRRIAPLVPAHLIRPCLQRLVAERKVAVLWHRYCLPHQVDAIRADWLATIDRCATEFDTLPGGQTTRARCRDALVRWDGWRQPSSLPLPGTTTGGGDRSD